MANSALVEFGYETSEDRSVLDEAPDPVGRQRCAAWIIGFELENDLSVCIDFCGHHRRIVFPPAHQRIPVGQALGRALRPRLNAVTVIAPHQFGRHLTLVERVLNNSSVTIVAGS